jgi:hypothetical protein
MAATDFDVIIVAEPRIVRMLSIMFFPDVMTAAERANGAVSQLPLRLLLLFIVTFENLIEI